MFERLTESAKRIKNLAEEEAINLETNYLGTEHILLAILKEGSMNRFIPFTHKEALDAVIDIIGKGTVSFDPHGGYPITPRSKKIFELALSEAIQMKNNYIGVNHILLGLLRENEGVAARVFENLEIDKEELIKIIRKGEKMVTTNPVGTFKLDNPFEKVETIKKDVPSSNLQWEIHKLISNGYNDFNITIGKQERSINGLIWYNIKIYENRDNLVKKAKEMFPMLDIK